MGEQQKFLAACELADMYGISRQIVIYRLKALGIKPVGRSFGREQRGFLYENTPELHKAATTRWVMGKLRERLPDNLTLNEIAGRLGVLRGVAKKRLRLAGIQPMEEWRDLYEITPELIAFLDSNKEPYQAPDKEEDEKDEKLNAILDILLDMFEKPRMIMGKYAALDKWVVDNKIKPTAKHYAP